MIKVASFDVFETALVRAVGEATSVFLLLGRSLTSGTSAITPESFASARIDAERRARRRIGARFDPTLEGIYHELAWSLRWSNDQRTNAMHRELELEASLLRPNPLAAARVGAARRRSLQIVYVSDTYLPSAFVARQLRDHGLFHQGDQLLASCESGGTKRAGELFSLVADRTGAMPRDIVHVGNDPVSDVRSAARHGIRTSPMFEGNLTSDEEVLETYRTGTGGLTSCLAGAARLARLQPNDGHIEPALRSGAADVAAPTLVAYVLWVLREAERRGLEVLYFLSREGQVLLDIARILVAKLGMSLEVRYLFASRQSLNLAALTNCSRAELAWTLTHAETNTIRTLLLRLGVQPEDVRSELEALAVADDSWDSVPDAATRTRLFRAVEAGPLQSHVAARAEQARTAAVEYLEQEAFLEDRPCGVVDISGVGSQFKALASLRARADVPAAVGFLFFRSRDPYLQDEGGYTDVQQPHIESYFDDAIAGVGHGTIPGLTQMLEMFCAADHGTVVDYRVTKQGVEPLLSHATATHLIEWGLPVTRRTIGDFAESLWLDERYVDLDADARAAIRAGLQRFWLEPTTGEARAWGSHPFEATSGHDEPEPLASAWTMSEVVSGVASRGIATGNWFRWRAASGKLSAPPVRALIHLARASKHTLRFVRSLGRGTT